MREICPPYRRTHNTHTYQHLHNGMKNVRLELGLKVDPEHCSGHTKPWRLPHTHTKPCTITDDDNFRLCKNHPRDPVGPIVRVAAYWLNHICRKCVYANQLSNIDTTFGCPWRRVHTLASQTFGLYVKLVTGVFVFTSPMMYVDAYGVGFPKLCDLSGTNIA